MRPDARELCSVWPVCALGFRSGFRVAWPVLLNLGLGLPPGLRLLRAGVGFGQCRYVGGRRSRVVAGPGTRQRVELGAVCRPADPVRRLGGAQAQRDARYFQERDGPETC